MENEHKVVQPLTFKSGQEKRRDKRKAKTQYMKNK